jgi:hypothetical protein
MKKIAVLLVSMLIVFGAFAQKLSDKDIPIGILNDLKNRYQTASNVQWSKDVEKLVAEFKNDGNNVRVEYLNSIWLQSYWNIPLEYMPMKIKDYISQYYAGFKIIKIDMLETNANEKSYVVKVVKKKKEFVDLYFELTGSFQKKVDKNEVKK